MVGFLRGGDMAGDQGSSGQREEPARKREGFHTAYAVDRPADLSPSRSSGRSGTGQVPFDPMGLADFSSPLRLMGLVPRHLRELYGKRLPSYLAGSCRYWNCPIHPYASAKHGDRPDHPHHSGEV